MSVKKMVQVGFLAAVGFLLMFTLEFPLPLLPPFLKYDPSEVPALIAAFAYGPWVGVLVELVKNVLFFVSGKATSGIIGFLGASIAGCTYVLVAGSVYEHWRTKKGAASQFNRRRFGIGGGNVSGKLFYPAAFMGDSYGTGWRPNHFRSCAF